MRQLFALGIAALLVVAACGRDEPAPATGTSTKTVHLKVDGMT